MMWYSDMIDHLTLPETIEVPFDRETVLLPLCEWPCKCAAPEPPRNHLQEELNPD